VPVHELEVIKQPLLEGKTYRVHIENWGIPGKATAADVVRFEEAELGNKYNLSDSLLKELDNYNQRDTMWVTKEKVDAEYYLSDGMTEEDISEIDLPKGSRIIAEDGQGGYLILRGDAKPKLPLPKVEASMPFTEAADVDRITASVLTKLDERLAIAPTHPKPQVLSQEEIEHLATKVADDVLSEIQTGEICCEGDLQPLEQWFAEEDPEEEICRTCLIRPLAEYYLGVLEKAGKTEEARQLQEDYETGDILTAARRMDIIKASVGPEVKSTLEYLDCMVQTLNEKQEANN
jgi:hypothetical protein